MQYFESKYRKTPKGVLTNMYHHMKARNIKNGFGELTFTLKEFHEKYLRNNEYLRIYNSWRNGGYQYYDKPSIDRIDRKKGYAFGNMRMMAWKKNRIKGDYEGAKRKSKSIDMFDLDGNYIKTFDSIKTAAIETGINRSLIGGCCNGQFERAKDLIFRFSRSFTPDHLVNMKTFITDEVGNVFKGKAVRYMSTGMIYPSARIAAQQFGIHENSVSRVCRGERPHVNGLKFEYVDKNDSAEIIDTVFDQSEEG